MKRYDRYKDSGIEWIGEIPSHWGIGKLKFYCEKITDGSHHSPPTLEQGKRYLSVKDIGNNELLFEDCKKISEEEFKLLVRNGCQPKKDDILLTKDGTIGRAAIVGDDNDFVVLSSLGIIRPNQIKLDTVFLREWLVSNLNVDQMLSLIQGSALTRITITIINNLIIPIPPLDEQFSIANFLDQKTTQIDDLIAKKERLNQLLEEERTAFINQAVTKGLDPSVSMKDSGIEWLGEIPAHWELMRIGSLSQCITGYAFKSENFSFEQGIKIVRGDNVTENSLRWGDKTRYWNEYSEMLDRFQLQKDDIVIGMDGSKVGKNYAFVKESDLPLLLVQRVARIRSNSELIAKWIHFNIGAYNFKYYINLSKTDPAIPHITLKNITSYPICIPDIDELNGIIKKLNSKLERLDETIENTKHEIELLKEYKTALISEVVTGKVDVRNEKMN